MINISGHLRNQRRIIGYNDNNTPLMVNCCGEQIFKTKDYHQARSNGRLDYQIIYVHKGSGHYLLDNEWKLLSSGNIILFKPLEPQVYSYYAKEQPEIYWIHFTGEKCETLINKFEIKNCYIGENLILKQLFQSIITELQLKKNRYEDIVVSNLYFMLAMISRLSQADLLSIGNDFSIDRLVIQLNQKYMEAWTISSMSDYCKLSEGYFSHKFKKQMGISPMSYLNELRIEKSKELLEEGTMNISTISSIVGFQDSLYFSKVFKKSTGMSPSKFKKYLLESRTPEWYSST
ncbi:AraC family transcriptional regulator [Clostridium tertium]|uniref:AraC family transcriptional regulator n=1 Tax=Clostridium tertium TaxID=1559 RepID=UPI001AE94F67|nr:helix-turn-helix domain-containing protein [Clostridium tertium]MBP1867199.1 AraC-like DNA-binding protein [Clostridium tertium]